MQKGQSKAKHVKKILVTGGNGFIGSNFILKNIHNYKIRNIDFETYAGSNNNRKK